MQYVLTVFLLFFSSSYSLADYISVDLQQAINNECKESVKKHEYPNNELCLESITQALNAQGVVSVKRIPDEKKQEYIEIVCVYEKKIGALEYNRCIYEQVYKALGLEIVEPPALVINVPVEVEEDPNEIETTPTTPEIETGESENQTNTEKKITKAIEIVMPEKIKSMIYKKVIPSTYFVSVWGNDPNTKKPIEIASGSGVSIATDLIATACHVVTTRLSKDDFEYLIVDVIHVDEDTSDPEKWFYDAKLYAEDFKTDRCIIKVDNLDAQPAKIRNYEELEVFETVFAVGNPRGFTGKTKQGEITRLYNFVPPPLTQGSEALFAHTNIELIETDASIDQGNSGGGLYDINGNLIGIVLACDMLGGAKMCIDKNGELTLNPGLEDQCFAYCNTNVPMNWSVPISRYMELLQIE